MMKESRERKRQKRAEITELLKESRSDLLIHEDCLNLGEIAGLTEALDAMVFYPIPKEFLISMAKSEDFKLEHYKSHILQSLRETYEILFDDISPLIDNTRKDRVFRFITLIFMSQWGDVELIQCGDKVMVEKIEAHS
jgi:hypothetical protein